MKKQLCTIILFILFAQLSFSQIKWGLYGGKTRSEFINKTTKSSFDLGGIGSIEFNDDQTMYSSGSSHFGWFIEPHIIHNLYFESGMIYEKRGFSKIEYYELHDMNHNYHYKMPYLGIPLSLNYYIVNKKFKLYILAGQKIGWFFEGEKGVSKNYRASKSGAEINVSTIRTEKIPVGKEGYFKSFNYDILLGGGIGVGRFYLVGVYNYGINNLSNINLFDYRIRVFNLSLKIDFSTK